jgi:hypothetical protein
MPVFRGWWIAVAQNVAPKRFHRHEEQRAYAEALQLALECDLPLYGLVSAWDCDKYFSGGSWFTLVQRGRLGGRSMVAGSRVVGEMSTMHRSPDRQLLVTTHRFNPLMTDATQRARLLNNFLATESEPSAEPMPEPDEAPLPPGSRRLRLQTAPPGAEWLPFPVVIDGKAYTFERLSIPNAWLALGDVGDVALSLSSRAVELDEVALARIEDPAAWVKGG